MTISDYLKDKNIVILGFGKQGRATFNYIRKHFNDKKITIADKRTKQKICINPKTNFVLGTYYKGTGIEEVTKKLEEYLYNCDKNESTINYI